MKRFFLSILSFFIAGCCLAQDPVVTSLNENFNISCASQSGFPALWYQFAVAGAQSWQCTPGQGIKNTPCMSMNDYTTHHNADTAWLITPKMDLSKYSKIYLNFFDRYSRSGDTLEVYVTSQYGGNGSPLCDSCSWTEIVIPFIQNDTLWREHQVDLTPYKAKPLYLGFKYSSSAIAGSIWYIDSVFTTQTLSVGQEAINERIPLTVLGLPGSDVINLEYTLPVTGTYQLNLFDITGRTLVKKTILQMAGTQHTAITNAYLPKGMYIVRLGNDSYTGFAKAVVQ
jgi:hypothetical protein